jgi:hypothetical protein
MNLKTESTSRILSLPRAPSGVVLWSQPLILGWLKTLLIDCDGHPKHLVDTAEDLDLDKELVLDTSFATLDMICKFACNFFFRGQS